jgi:hypothetical protein
MTSAERTPEGSGLAERDVAEIPLLLPAQELAALEQAACHRELTTAQLLRLLVRSFLAGRNQPSFSRDPQGSA